MRDAVQVGRLGLAALETGLAQRGMKCVPPVSPARLHRTEGGAGETYPPLVLPPQCDDGLVAVLSDQLCRPPLDRFEEWADRISATMLAHGMDMERTARRLLVACETSLPVFDATRSHALLYVHVLDPQAPEGRRWHEGWILCFARVEGDWILVGAEVIWVAREGFAPDARRGWGSGYDARFPCPARVPCMMNQEEGRCASNESRTTFGSPNC